LFGWLVGASDSPIVSTAAPLVFGLLAILGITAGAYLPIRRKRGLWRNSCRLFCTAFGVGVFCYWCWNGIQDGMYSRAQYYESMADLVGPEWGSSNASTTSLLYEFRWRAKRAGVAPLEFNKFITGVISPILKGNSEHKQRDIEQAIETVETSLTTPTPSPAKTPDQLPTRTSPK
jgi:hypothetical protein